MQSLSATRPKSRSRTWIFRLIYVVIIAAGIAGYLSLRGASAELDLKNAELTKAPVIAGKVQVGDAQVTVPLYDFFATGEMWSLTSKNHPLEDSFTVKDLVDSPIATGGGETLQVSKRIIGPLNALVAAAKADGHDLMISSAYRSITDQQATYDSFVSRYGQEMAGDYVSPPGSSEHHTGLAIDLSNVSDACKADSEQCSLGMESAKWLTLNGPQYGFVLRYPEGKKSITGVGHEWWHYRYVGVPLAQALATSDLTLDEAIERMQSRH